MQVSHAEAISLLLSLPPTEAVLVRGNHGIGKSELGASLAQRLDYPLLDYRLAQISSEDLVGMPRKSEFDCLGKSTEIMRYIPPMFIAQACLQPAVLFLDELNRGTPEVIAAAFQAVLDRRVMEHRFHPETRVIAAINENSSRYQVNELDPALLDRFVVLDLRVTHSEWIDYMTRKYSEYPITLSFLQDNVNACITPSTVTDPNEVTPSYRSWDKVLQVFKTWKLQEDEILKNHNANLLCAARVGTVAIAAYREYLANHTKFLSVEEVLAGGASVRTKVANMIDSKATHLLTTFTSQYLKIYLEENKLTKSQISGLREFLRILPSKEHFSTVIAMLGSIDATKGTKYISTFVDVIKEREGIG